MGREQQHIIVITWGVTMFSADFVVGEQHRSASEKFLWSSKSADLAIGRVNDIDDSLTKLRTISRWYVTLRIHFIVDDRCVGLCQDCQLNCQFHRRFKSILRLLQFHVNFFSPRPFRVRDITVHTSYIGSSTCALLLISREPTSTDAIELIRDNSFFFFFDVISLPSNLYTSTKIHLDLPLLASFTYAFSRELFFLFFFFSLTLIGGRLFSPPFIRTVCHVENASNYITLSGHLFVPHPLFFLRSPHVQ